MQKISNICLIVILVATLVMVGGMFSGLFVEQASLELLQQVVIWSSVSVAALCCLLMLFLGLEPEPATDEASTGEELETGDAPFEDVELAETSDS